MERFKHEWVILSLLIALLFSPLVKAKTVIIVHPSNESTIDNKIVQRIFLGKEKAYSNGREVLPINQASESPARVSFDKTILNRSTAQLTAYWSRLVFTGNGIPPKEVLDDSAVIAIVSSNIDAIGYINANSASKDVKTIKTNN